MTDAGISESSEMCADAQSIGKAAMLFFDIPERQKMHYGQIGQMELTICLS